MPVIACYGHRNPSEARLTKALRDIRRARDLSLDQLAAALDLSVRDYFEREIGRQSFTDREIDALSRELRLDVRLLMGEVLSGALQAAAE